MGPQHGVNLVLLLEAREVMGTVRAIGHRDMLLLLLLMLIMMLMVLRVMLLVMMRLTVSISSSA